MTVFIDYAPIKGCRNPDTYGEICVKCNKCHRFNPRFTCLNCGRRTTAMKSYFTWKFVELWDVFRAPLCPYCQQYFTYGEMAIGREWWDRDIISGYKRDFRRRNETPLQ